MSERLEVLARKLPAEVLAKIARYDSHPTADLIRTLKFRDIQATSVHPARKAVTATPPTYFCPIVWEIMYRKSRNATRDQTGRLFLPIFGDPHTWLLSFDEWRFNTLSDLEYLPDWAVEEYLARRASKKCFFEEKPCLSRSAISPSAN